MFCGGLLFTLSLDILFWFPQSLLGYRFGARRCQTVV
uniref:Uncharacterized protein n=1 Tax=Arundo donax TaxID=35708 RepID=A0A0A9DNS6_ARUDO